MILSRKFLNALLCLVFLAATSLMMHATERGPSTPEERAKVLKLTKSSEVNLMSGTTGDDRFWFLKVVAEVPDISLTIGNVATWCTEFGTEEQQSLALFQFMLSAVSFQIENPAKSKDEELVDLAGLEGVLRAYENLLKETPKVRSSKLDDAISIRNKGGLLSFVKQLRSKK